MTWIHAADVWLLSASARVRWVVISITLVVMAVTVVPKVPRAFVDYSRWPLLAGVTQPQEFGTDTIADAYEARVVRHHLADMYTKREVEQTPLEASTWSKEASSPYPPVTLIALAALSAIGDAAGIGLYGMVSLLALLFLGASLVYFLRTRWYLFPLLYLNCGYVGQRFFSVQDGSYLVMLSLVMAALFVARRQPTAAHTLMAVAITTKLSPLYYLRHLPRMSRRAAPGVVAILAAGLVAPYVIWENYLYIFRYNSELKGDMLSAFGALALAGAFTALLFRAERRRAFDLEDLIGWSLVPMALFLAFKMNVARHLLLVLLVPDKHGLRNVAVASGLAIHAVMPGLIGINGVLPTVMVVIVGGIVVGSGVPGFRGSGVR
jgi:hypothetical protein